MAQKQKRERFVTPRGIAVWPRLNEPDTKFKPEGEFSVKLRYADDDADALKLVAKLEKMRDEEFAKFISENPKKKKVAKLAPIAKPELDDEGEETGFFTLNFKMKHKIKTKAGKTFTLTPDIFDARKNKLTKVPNIGGGSTLKVSFESGGGFLVPASNEFHLTLRLIGVQIIDLVQFGERTADQHGFDDEGEDGYEAEAGSDNDDDADGDDADDGDDDGDEDGDGDY